MFNWLYARHAGGSFIVRIEDTDQSRLVPGAMDAILDALSWLGLDWDEGPGKDGAYGPYIQSERLPLYQEHAERLVTEGNAYFCYCTEERIDQVRRAKQAKGDRSGYDRRCRDPIEAEKAKAENPNPVVRFKTPLEGSSTVDDFVRGPVTFDVSLLDDFVLLKSDGFPKYHLANVVDDHAMEITHVMRAEEWLPSAPRHQMLYEALGYDMPRLVHLPIILGPDRAKLSKRHGATSVLQFRDDGYLPDAMLNFLALLGWSLDETSELFTRDELIEHFTLERIISSSAVFNHEKLTGSTASTSDAWATTSLRTPSRHGSTARRATSPRALVRLTGPISPRSFRWSASGLKKLSDAPEMLSFFFQERLAYDDAALVQKGMDAEGTRAALEQAIATAESVGDWSVAPLESAYRALAPDLGIKTGQLFGTIRVAVTGRTAAPPLFDTLAVLGKDRCLTRMRAALAAL